MRERQWWDSGELDVECIEPAIYQHLSQQAKERVAHSDPVGNEITLVDDQDDLFMCLLPLDEIQDGLTHGTQRIASVQNVENDIGRINDLVEFAVYTTRSAFGIDRFDIIGMRLWLCSSRLRRVCRSRRT
jgi:hypothetical protein